MGKPTHTLVPCWMPKPLPPRNQCTGWFALANNIVGSCRFDYAFHGWWYMLGHTIEMQRVSHTIHMPMIFTLKQCILFRYHSSCTLERRSLLISGHESLTRVRSLKFTLHLSCHLENLSFLLSLEMVIVWALILWIWTQWASKMLQRSHAFSFACTILPFISHVEHDYFTLG